MDFVLYGKRGIRTFEIKRTGKVSMGMLKGLKSFLKDYPMAKAYFIYGGERWMKEGDIQIIPLNDLLKGLGDFL